MGLSPEMITIVCSVIGAIEISYVESRVIAKSGSNFRKDSLTTKYWYQLSTLERCLFWTGLPMLAAPFILALAG